MFPQTTQATRSDKYTSGGLSASVSSSSKGVLAITAAALPRLWAAVVSVAAVMPSHLLDVALQCTVLSTS
jgi:hypothetical protein